MSHTVRDIADALGLEARGDVSLPIRAAAEPGDAGPEDLAMAMSPKYAEGLGRGRARAALVWQGADWQAMGLEAAIFVARPRLAMSGLSRVFDPGQGLDGGIHPAAHIDDSAHIGADVSIGPGACIGARARIGDRSVIGPNTVIGMDAVIGQDALIRDQVSIGARVRIGDRFICQPGARIGADGFSFVTPELSTTEAARETMGDSDAAQSQSWVRIHSLGAVTIGNDVEIGANATVDNGTVRNTEIGEGTKLDNLVHIGHNSRVGRHCLLCGQVGVSGSVDIGDYAVLGGQVGVADNTKVGKRAILTGATKATSNVPPGRVMMGYPAVKMELHTEIYKAQRRLPRLMQQVAALQKAVFKDGPSD
ncbi:MAG: UDP-3-O-(3-hydroxymyristoyl)glucosamine N-acyltransferase [Paracoccaceae bacterium]